MPWPIIILIRAFICQVIGTILLKNISGLDSRIRNLSWMFFFCAVISIVSFPVLLYFKYADLFWISEMKKIALIHMFTNSLGCYFFWRAADISISKTTIFSQGNYCIAFILGLIFMEEAKLLNPGVIIGIILCFGSGIIFAFYKESTLKGKDDLLDIERRQKNRTVIYLAIAFSLCWGIDDFFTRYFALKEIPTINYLIARYIGTYAGTLLLLLIASTVIKIGINKVGFDEKKDLIKAPIKGRVGQIFILAIVNAWLPQVLEYQARQEAPLVGTEPIFLILAITVPTALIFYFVPFFMKLKIIPKKYLERVYEEHEEVKSIPRIEKIAYVIGILGGIFVGFSLSA